MIQRRRVYTIDTDAIEMLCLYLASETISQ